MRCDCGDTHCWSCGPALGNFKCLLCGAWADDGCDHIDEDGCEREEFVAEFDAARERERKDYDRLVEELER